MILRRFPMLCALALTALQALGQVGTPLSADSLAQRYDSLARSQDSLTLRLASLPQRLDSVLTASPLSKTVQVGIMVWDLRTDSCLYSRGETTVVRPASTMKLLTAVAALQALGDSAMVAADSLNQKLVVDFSMKDTVALGEGWCWDDDNPRLNTTDSTVTPHPLVWLLTPMLKESNNLAAETVFYTLAARQEAARQQEQKAKQAARKTKRRGNKDPQPQPVGSKQAQREVERFIHSLVDYTPWLQLSCGDMPLYRVADGSGLSLYNYVTPQLLVACLRYAWLTDFIRPALCQNLPVAGIDGTLAERMKHGAVTGRVWAKTGTLSGVSSLAGYFPDRPLAFAIVCNGAMRQRPARNLIDSLCEEFGK